MKHKIEDLKSWDEIKKEFIGSDILLGNGFSININSCFHYKSIYSEFIKQVSPKLVPIFNSFRTTNFERIMGLLQTACLINTKFEIDSKEIESAINELRLGLIQTIEKLHPRKDDLDWERLGDIATKLGGFNDIYTINYDLLLYHIILIQNDRYNKSSSKHRYNDYFWNDLGDDMFLGFMNYQSIPDYRHVYYLHGSLFIYDYESSDFKLRKSDSSKELIELIADIIQTTYVPNFVSEGSAEDKLRTIKGSEYLKFANNKFSSSTNNIVLYGISLDDSDKHIISALNTGKSNIAVSIFRGNRSEPEIIDEMNNYDKVLSSENIYFYDSTSLF